MKKTNIMAHDVSTTLVIIGDHNLDVVEKLTYLGSTKSNNLSMDVHLNVRIGKAASAIAHLAKRV